MTPAHPRPAVLVTRAVFPEVVARLQSPATGDAGLVMGAQVALHFAPGSVQVLED